MAVLQLLFQTRIPDVIRRPRAHTCVAKPISRRESWKAYTYGGVPPASAGFPCTCGRNVPCRGGFHSDQGARQRIFLRASGDFLLRLRIPAAKKMADPPSSSDQEGPLFRGASEPVWLNFYECLKLVAVIFREGCSRIGAMSGFLWDSGSTCLGSVADSGGRFVGRLAKAVMKCVDGQFEFV